MRLINCLQGAASSNGKFVLWTLVTFVRVCVFVDWYPDALRCKSKKKCRWDVGNGNYFIYVLRWGWAYLIQIEAEKTEEEKENE